MSRARNVAKLAPNNAGVLPATNLNTSAITGALGYTPVINISTVRSSTRTSMPLTNTHIAFSGNFTKIRSDSIIIATATIFGAPFNSGNCGVGLRLNTTWDYGMAFQYDGAWGSSQTTIIVGTGRWTGVSSGTHTMAFGWNTINGSTSDRPFTWLNPNNADDARNQQMISSIVIYEVAS